MEIQPELKTTWQNKPLIGEKGLVLDVFAFPYFFWGEGIDSNALVFPPPRIKDSKTKRK